MMSSRSSPSWTTPRKWVRPQPFYTAILLVTFLVTVSYLQTLISDSPASQEPLAPILGARSTPHHCRDVHQHPDDTCAFVRANCEDEQPGLAPYLELYYCNPGHARPFVFVLLVFWLGLLFMTIGIAASDFFTPNLQTIAAVLSMPENLTGVTFLALGNGSPDLFSTIMSMRSNSAAMAVGELIGAASFITAIVAGSIAMVKEFRVDKQTFVRDLLFFAVAVMFTLWFLLDGHLHYRECIFMIAYYIFYVVVVSGLHWWSNTRANRHARIRERSREIESLLRSLGQERYQDEQPPTGPEGNEGPPPAPTAHPVAVSAEGMPRIEIESAGAEEEQRAGEDVEEEEEEEEEEMEHRRHMGAEIANSMRVRRPTASRRNTATFIRPSLVGALEFNAAFGRFKKEVRAEPHQQRLNHMRRHSMQNMPNQTGYDYPPTGPTGPTITADEYSPNRDRSYSHAGNVTVEHGGASFPELIEPISEASSGSASASPRNPPSLQRAPSSTRSFQLDGNLAVPPAGHDPSRSDHLGGGGGGHSLDPNVLRLDVPSRRSTGDQPDTLSPFPVYTDSPMPMSPRSESGRVDSGLPILPSQSVSRQVTIESQTEVRHRSRLWRWMPRGFPSPENIVATLFPTMQNWREKGPLDAFVSAISVPSFFLLSVTLPVVDAKSPESDNGSDCSVSEVASDDDPAFERFDNEWDMFRRHRHGASPASSIRGPTSRPLSLMGVDDAAVVVDDPGVPKVVRGRDGSVLGGEQQHQPLVQPPVADSEEDLMGWNKWQVLLQVLAGPPFAVFITASILLEQDGDVTVKAMWWSTLASALLFLAVLVSTRADRRPKYHSLLCFPGFLVSVSWIAAIAGEVVGVLKAIGVIWGISEAILGLTVFAAGNSVGDWVSNYTIAKLGSPVMAFSGCIGGPMLNILLGISTGGLVGMRAKARHRREKHPDLPVDLKPFKIQISGSLVVTAVTLLVTLLALLVFISANKWVFSRRLGMGLALLWCVSTGVNLVIEGTGVWSDVV